jgi:methionyl-tRNA synthetase
VPASQESPWGIAIERAGFTGQVISPWLEVALAGGYLADRWAPGGRIHHLFGFDNAFLYLIHDPAASLALDPGAELPAVLVANEFLMLDDAKMSTSGGHALDADAVLAQVPADLLRLYLARIRPEDVRTSASLPAAQVYMTLVAQHWQGWLARLGACVAAEAAGAAPAPANPSLAPWSAEQTAFLGYLGQLAGRAQRAYEDGSLKEAAAALHELAERATSFGATQVHLAGVPSLAGQRATGLALELAAARAFAAIAAPLMPAFAERLWRCLGYTGPITWGGDVELVPPGQRIDAAGLAARFFPERIELGA